MAMITSVFTVFGHICSCTRRETQISGIIVLSPDTWRLTSHCVYRKGCEHVQWHGTSLCSEQVKLLHHKIRSGGTIRLLAFWDETVGCQSCHCWAWKFR